VRQGDWKLLLDAGNPMLYNLANDVGERNDLASQRTDIVRKLFPLITQWEADVDAEAKALNPAAPSTAQQ
jgi:arylsulfatase A